MNEDRFKYVESAVKWLVVTALWSLIGLTLLGLGAVARWIF